VTALLTRHGPPLIVAVTGPRQTGKTTIIRQALRQTNLPSRYVAVDDPLEREWGMGSPGSLLPHLASHENFEGLEDTAVIPRVRDADWLVRVWEDARQIAGRSTRGSVLALDEIQLVEGWSGVVKGLWDRDRATGCPLRVILSGSAPWSMLIGMNESLAGRFMPVRVRHWSFAEMESAFAFGLDEYLYYGGYPGAAPLNDDPEEWREYVRHAILRPSIERDVISLSHIRKPALMERLVDLALEYSGQVLSFNKMVGQLQDAGNTTTLARYLGLLEDAGIVVGLLRYSAKPHRNRASSPKLNVLNTALLTASSGYTFDEAAADRTFWGRIVESAVGAHLHNTLSSGIKVHYWRAKVRRVDHEVDFVLSHGSRLLAIEVKSGPKVGSLRGLAAFGDRFRNARTLVVRAWLPTHRAHMDRGDAAASADSRNRQVSLAEFLAAPARHWLEGA
jgi:predicted AAA+ superfamily ATPase